MNRLLNSILLACLVIAVVVAALAIPNPLLQASDTKGQKADSQPAMQAASTQPAPQELLSAYIQAVKETPECALARAFDPEKVQEAAKQWGYKLEYDKMTFWEWNVHYRSVPVKLPDGSKARLRLEDPNNWGGPIVLEVTRPGDPPSQYPVSPAKLQELSFKTVVFVTVPEPACIPMENFIVETANLAEVALELCRRANLDYSFRQDLARSIHLTMVLRGKTVVECFEAIARVTGWNIGYLHGWASDNQIPPCYSVTALGGGHEFDRGIGPLEVLKQRIEWQMQPKWRPTVVLTPPGQTGNEVKPGGVAPGTAAGN